LAVLFGEDSWNLYPKYDYDSVSMEDLYMLQVMYNQAAARTGFSTIPAYVASTISSRENGYNGYNAGRGLLTAAAFSSIGSNACDHLISAEATYSEFWDGLHNISSVNLWASAWWYFANYGKASAGWVQIAGTVFWYGANVVSGPPHRLPPIRLPNPPPGLRHAM
jgi:hypothetical protein